MSHATTKVYTLKKPIPASIVLLSNTKEKHRGTLGRLNVTIENGKMKIEGVILAATDLAKKMTDVNSRCPTGTFDAECKNGEDRIIIRRVTGERTEEFWLGGVRMANVYFSQNCLKSKNYNSEEAKHSDELDRQAFIPCPTYPPDYPSLGDIFYDEDRKIVRMYMSYGWMDFGTEQERPMIINGKAMAIPDYCTTFFCEPLHRGKRTSDVHSRRAQKVMEMKKRRTKQ